MNKISRKSFLPTEISESIAMPDEDLMVTFRCTNNIKNIPLTGWYTQDINAVCRKIVVRQLKINTAMGNFDQISNQLSQDLVHLNQTQRLNIIGGFQSSPTTVEALFYQTDRAPTTELQLKMLNLHCPQWGSSEEQVKQVTDQIQNVHIDDDGILRCILSLERARTEQKYHILVFAIADGNKDYSVQNFPEYLQE